MFNEHRSFFEVTRSKSQLTIEVTQYKSTAQIKEEYATDLCR